MLQVYTLSFSINLRSFLTHYTVFNCALSFREPNQEHRNTCDFHVFLFLIISHDDLLVTIGSLYVLSQLVSDEYASCKITHMHTCTTMHKMHSS